jgi:hypothetical protein
MIFKVQHLISVYIFNYQYAYREFKTKRHILDTNKYLNEAESD